MSRVGGVFGTFGGVCRRETCAYEVVSGGLEYLAATAGGSLEANESQQIGRQGNHRTEE